MGLVHALVIGVGHYTAPNLPALPGAVQAALAFADWLKGEHRAPGHTLGEIQVLASDGGAPVTWDGRPRLAPTLANVRAAVDEWHRLGDLSPDGLLVFYFCGHGIEIGDLRSLLLADVDPTLSTDPFRNAIAFNDFARGMDSCAARQQVYVLDACRELPAGFGAWDDGVALGEPLVRFNLKKRAKLAARACAILEATSATQRAWAGASGGAWFTAAMLTVLRGAAGDNRFTASPDEYRVSTRDIADVIKLLTQEGFLDAPAGPQSPVRKGEGDLDFHAPAPTMVPVLVTRKPPASNSGVTFNAQGPTNESHTCADECPWRSTLPVGDYVFTRDADQTQVQARVAVPKKRVELP